MSKKPLLLLAGLAIIGAGCAPAAPPKNASVSFGSSVTLTTGSSATFEDGLHATLKAVNDSRCKPGVVCIWAGELSPVVELSGGSLAASTEVTLGTTTRKDASAGPYSITLVGATETTATISVNK